MDVIEKEMKKEGMTVREFIEKLKKYDPDMQIGHRVWSRHEDKGIPHEFCPMGELEVHDAYWVAYNLEKRDIEYRKIKAVIVLTADNPDGDI